MKQPFPSLPTERLFLNAFTASDAATVQRLAGDERVSRTTDAIPHPYIDGLAEEWIGTHAELWGKAKQAVWAVRLAPQSELIGCVGLVLTLRHARAELGYWMGHPWWSQGYTTEATRAVLTWGVENLGLNRIDAVHLVGNPASGAVMQKLGMRHEGTLRDYMMHEGVFEDVEQYAVLAADFLRCH